MKGFRNRSLRMSLHAIPGARVARMDLDTTRKKGSFDRIIGDLETGKTDILIGTQMISKGLDFENLTVVGILNIDNMLYFPDFRSHEKCFQMIEQVSGRAGRRSKQGKVIVQTFDPFHPVMVQALNHNFRGMIESQLHERKEFNYPPFTRLIKLYVRHRDRGMAIAGSAALADRLRGYFGNRILGPEPPLMSRVQSYFIMAIIIKLESTRGAQKAKSRITGIIGEIKDSGDWPGLKIHADVDPV
ncbi:MAG: helicase-related protein [Bacteroidales bacterium]